MIFAVLENWYHHIVLTHSCKLVSFLHIYLLFFAKSRGMSLTHVISAIRFRIFTFYVFKEVQYTCTSGRVQNVGCLLLLLLLLRCCSSYLEIKVGCGRLRLTSSNCQTLNPHLRQMQGSWWYLLYKPRYSPFCLKFCCHGNKGLLR